MKAPVLFIIFRRPETTAVVFEAIRGARPDKLYIAADGPRPGRPDDAAACAETRALVAHVDWPCEVKTRFLDENHGIKKGVAGAITWFFDQEPEGIILEDDCLPHPDFFPYCAELLARYRHDDRVAHIGGVNFQPRRRSPDADYYFSRYNHVWGWASWRRAWQKYRPEFEGLDRFLWLADRTGFWDSPNERTYWSKTFRVTRHGGVVTWDYQWKYSLWADGALGITPEANLVVNVGFGAGATNTSDASGNKKARPHEPLATVRSPAFVLRDRTADRYTFLHKYWGTPTTRLAARLRRLVRIIATRKV